MRHLPADKYNVAWFKLAEYVSRKEKERALGLYRLLVHSFSDKALAAQLEGDLLLSFNDKAAIDCYLQAAKLYQNQGKIAVAIAVHEHVLLLEPYTEVSIKALLGFYHELNNKTRLFETFKLLSAMFIAHHKFDELILSVQEYERIVSKHVLQSMYIHIVFACCKQNNVSDHVKILFMQKAVDTLLESDNASLQQFLESLKNAHEELYVHACDYLEK